MKKQKDLLEKVQVSSLPFLVTPEGDIVQNDNQVLGLHCHHEAAHIHNYFSLGNYNVVKTLVIVEPMIPERIKKAVHAICEMEDINMADIAIDNVGLPVLLFIKMVHGKEKMPELIVEQLIQDFGINRRYLHDIDEESIFVP